MDEFNTRTHNSLSGADYSEREHDSVMGADCKERRNKILRQVFNNRRKTEQLGSVLKLSVGERTEISLNTRIDDGMINDAGNQADNIWYKYIA